jgi:hypothetical protein
MVPRLPEKHPEVAAMSKRAQLTVFIIIGIVILLTIGMTVYLTTQKIVKPVEEEVIVPEDVRPVYEHVQSCANEIARDALGLLGLQGGFISLPGIIERTPTAYIPADSANLFKVPLWYYEGEDRTPSVGYMEREISRYLNERLSECADGFEQFKPEYAVTLQGNASTRTVIAEDSVIVRVSWPLELRAADRTTRLNDFVVRMPVRLRQMWELANATMATENDKTPFENLTIDLMAADSANIPMDGFTIECGVKRWNLNEVRKRLDTVLYYNIPTARVKNTQYSPFAESASTYEALRKDYQRMTKELIQGNEKPTPPKRAAPNDAYQYFKLLFDVGARPTDLKMGFEYQPAWGLQINAQPSEGATLKSNAGKGTSKYLRFLCINQWHFAYDIIYYVKATVRDDNAFDGKGYTFQFAFPVLINDNAAERIAFGAKKFQSLDFGAPEFCDTLGTQPADIRAFGAMEGVPVLMELPDARITYTCVDQECDLGSTQSDGGTYRLSTVLPQGCTNPFIKASKEGYLDATAQMTTDRLDLKLTKLQDVTLNFVVHPYHGQTQTWAEPRPLGKDEHVSLQVSIVNRTFDQFLGFPTLNETLRLAQETAHYDIDAMLFLRDNQIGGYHAETFKIPYDTIAGKTAATIHVVQYLPTAITDDQKLKMIEYLMEAAYPDALQPEFS